MRIVVESIEGLSYSLPDIWKLKPVVLFNKEAWQILPFKSQAGIVCTMIDKDGKELNLRLLKLEPIIRQEA